MKIGKNFYSKKDNGKSYNSINQQLIVKHLGEG